MEKNAFSFLEFYKNLGQLWRGLQGPSEPAPRSVEEDPSVSRKTLIAREFVRACVAWMVLYVIFFVCLLGFKWQTKGFYEADYQRKLAAQTKAAENPKEWWKKHDPTVKTVVDSIRNVAKNQDTTLKALLQQQNTLRDLKAKAEAISLESTDEVGSHVQLSTSLQDLLQIASLSDIEGSTLVDLFEKTIRDLQDLLETEGPLNWTAMDQQLAEIPMPARVTSRLPEDFACPSSEEIAAVAASIPVEAPKYSARQSDLVRRIHKVEGLMHRRAADGLNTLLLPDTMKDVEENSLQPRLEALMDTMVEMADQVSAAKAAKKGRADGSCWSQEDVLEIIEDGLVALQQGADLRNVLRKKVMELDPSATSIILDADLPPSMPHMPASPTVNLRHILDTPLLQNLAPVVDQLVEFGGGYNDDFDQWVDSLAASRESVGDLMVTKILDTSGKVEIPKWKTFVKEYLPPQVQELLQRNSMV